ncbi:glycerophosphodiester phosphodiesterase family protein [Sphingoaurantiacus capsulatus]|uniref:Glycerophosphodiester phosphodiesterase family protein n=1 Tax=Sphingoaurantiacus capsulatus TaxID=1771310 RepID=A0ABV7X6S8_9SPHN
MFWPKLDIEKSALSFLTRQPYAHRGLHDEAAGIPENSLAAFDRAIERGYGLELDVRMTRDGDVIVFHDPNLDRMTDGRGQIALMSWQQLKGFKLKNSDETLKTLHDILLHVRGRVPVLIEVKATENKFLPACFAVRRALEGYRGAAAVMSFHPGVSAWFALHAPKVVRGLVMTETDGRAFSKYNIRKRIRRQLLVSKAKPHFIAYDIRRLPSPFIAAARERGMKILAWTVRGDAAHAVAAKAADQVIFEGELPAGKAA